MKRPWMESMPMRPAPRFHLLRTALPLLLSACLVNLLACTGYGNPERSSSQLAFGVDMAKRGLWNEALFRFHEAEKADPQNPRVHNDLGVAYEAQGDFEQALQHYRKALQLAPNDRDVRANYARFVEFYQGFKGEGKGKAGKGEKGEAPGTAGANTPTQQPPTGGAAGSPAPPPQTPQPPNRPSPFPPAPGGTSPSPPPPDPNKPPPDPNRPPAGSPASDFDASAPTPPLPGTMPPAAPETAPSASR